MATAIGFRSRADTAQAGGLVLVTEGIVASRSPTTAAVLACPAIWLSAQSWRSRGEAKLLFLIVGGISGWGAAIRIIVRTTDPSVPCVVLEASAPSPTGGRVATSACLLVRALGRAWVAELAELIFDPFKWAG